jgi:hypothetical protein
MSDPHPCEGQIRLPSDGWHTRYKPCGKRGHICEEGHWYCGTHRPSRRQDRYEAWKAKHERERAEEAHAAALLLAEREVARCALEVWRAEQRGGGTDPHDLNAACAKLAALTKGG